MGPLQENSNRNEFEAFGPFVLQVNLALDQYKK